MEEFYRELQEDLQREKLRGLWKRYGGIAIVLSVSTILGTVAAVGWQHIRDARAEDRTQALIAALESPSPAQAEAALAPLSEGTGGTAPLARLHRAALLSKGGKQDEALALYRALHDASTADPALRALAGAQLLAAGEKTQEAQPGAPFYYSQAELSAWNALEAGDRDSAAKSFAALGETVGAPPGLSERARRVSSYLGTQPEK